MQTPLAFIKLNFDLFSFSSPEQAPVDVFLTKATFKSFNDGRSVHWYTFPKKERLRVGVDANGTLKFEVVRVVPLSAFN